MLSNINIGKLKQDLKLIKRNLATIGLSLVIGSTSISGCGEAEEVPVSTIETEVSISKMAYADKNVSIRTVENEGFISIYVKTPDETNYTKQFYNTLESELSKGIYTRIELANLDSEFDTSKLDLNGFDLVHLNCCQEGFNYSDLSQYHFRKVYVDELSESKNRISKVLPNIDSDTIIMNYNYIGEDVLELYNLDIKLNENVQNLDLNINCYSRLPFEFRNVTFDTNNDKFSLMLGTTLSCGQVTKNTKFTVPDNSSVILSNVDIISARGLEGFSNCNFFECYNENDVITYNKNDDWSEVIESFNNKQKTNTK